MCESNLGASQRWALGPTLRLLLVVRFIFILLLFRVEKKRSLNLSWILEHVSKLEHMGQISNLSFETQFVWFFIFEIGPFSSPQFSSLEVAIVEGPRKHFDCIGEVITVWAVLWLLEN